MRTLRPNEVTPAQAEAVLEFLNSAVSPEEIALATDSPGVHDIGIRLAERILERRGELGSFTSVAQLLEVPLIGPIRFTHIILGLAGPGDRKKTTWRSDEGLQREIRELRAQVGALLEGAGRKPRLTIRALQRAPWLGEAINLVIELRSPEGVPLRGIPLTLTTTWGTLRTRDGVREVHGASVTTRTDPEGRARALFRPATSEPLNEVQQSSLSFALSRLDREATTPRQAAESLHHLSTEYRAPGNDFLREAMDIYFRDFGAAVSERINSPDPLLTWDGFAPTIIAFSHAEPEEGIDSGVDGIAALNLRIRNWITPWLDFLRQTIHEQSHLEADLQLAIRRDAHAPILGTVYKRLRDFLEDEPGRAGAFVGRNIAERALADFVDGGMRELPLQTQITLTPTLQSIAEDIRSTGSGRLASNYRMQSELTREVAREVDQKIGTLLPPDWIDGLNSELGRLGDQLNTKIDQSQLERVRVETERAVQQLSQLLDGKVGLEQFDRLHVELQQSLKEADHRLEKMRIEVNTEIARFARQIDTKVGQGDLQRLQGEFKAALDARVPLEELNALRIEMHDALAQHVPIDRFTAHEQRVDAALRDKADLQRVAALDENVVALDRNLLALKTTTSDVATSVARIDQSVTRLDGDIRTIRRTR